MIDEFKLAELLNAKFCHDLAGPIGAISNGIEFLNEDNEAMKQKARGLVEISAEQAVSRLQFFRQLYGSMPDIGEANLLQFKELSTNFFKSSKIAINWDSNDIMNGDIKVSHRLAKLILNFIVVASSALIKGGKINVMLMVENNKLITEVLAIGEEIRFDEETAELIRGNVNITELSSKNIQHYYTGRLIKALGVNYTINKSSKELKILVEQV